MGKYYVGIDLGGTDIKAGVIDDSFSIIAKHVSPTLTKRSVEEIVSDMVAAGKSAVNKAGINERDILHVGIGVPGTVNSKTNIVVLAPNLGWKHVDLIPIFKKYWDVPIFFGNDADAAALAEVYAGAAKGYDNAVLLTLGTGVGGGLVFDKKLYSCDGYSPEPGHIIIVVDGKQCTCGTRGCLEAYASVTALIRDAKDIMAKNPDSLLHKYCDGDDSRINGKMIFDAASHDDIAAKMVVADYVKYLGAGIASLCNALRPQVVILGGGVSNAGTLLFEPLEKIVKSLIFASEEGKLPSILQAKLGNDAGTLGAALFGIRS